MKLAEGNNAGFILAHSGEEVLSLDKLNVASKMVDNLIKMYNQGAVNRLGSNINNVELNISLPNVKDVDSFVTELQSNKRFEKIVKSITNNIAIGSNSLNKYRF